MIVCAMLATRDAIHALLDAAPTYMGHSIVIGACRAGAGLRQRTPNQA